MSKQKDLFGKEAMTPEELRAALKISKSTYYRLLQAGRLDRFALLPRIGPRRYSLTVVRAYLDREPRQPRKFPGEQ